MTNLVRVLERDGRADEAREWQRRLAAIEPYPPFYYLDRGLAALSEGDNQAARELLTKELRRMPYYHEVHFALAVADMRLGEVREARNHLELALQYSTRATGATSTAPSWPSSRGWKSSTEAGRTRVYHRPP
jgi:tetratricopeptide (TPR) repeat protein